MLKLEQHLIQTHQGSRCLLPDGVRTHPQVRSSYRAGELFVKNILRKEVAEVAGVADTTAELDLASLVQGSEARRGKLAAAMRGS